MQLSFPNLQLIPVHPLSTTIHQANLRQQVVPASSPDRANVWHSMDLCQTRRRCGAASRRGEQDLGSKHEEDARGTSGIDRVCQRRRLFPSQQHPQMLTFAADFPSRSRGTWLSMRLLFRGELRVPVLRRHCSRRLTTTRELSEPPLAIVALVPCGASSCCYCD
ncbi:unnamed protein product [Urochloa humidicola]